jgi:hypothetical protein
MKQSYAVINQKTGISIKTGKLCTTITLIGLDDRCEYPTYIDKSMRNYEKWIHIINHPNNGYILDNLELITRKGKTVIDADCDPIIVHETTDADQLYISIKKMWADVDKEQFVNSSQGCKNKFNDLFE